MLQIDAHVVRLIPGDFLGLSRCVLQCFSGRCRHQNIITAILKVNRCWGNMADIMNGIHNSQVVTNQRSDTAKQNAHFTFLGFGQFRQRRLLRVQIFPIDQPQHDGRPEVVGIGIHQFPEISPAIYQNPRPQALVPGHHSAPGDGPIARTHQINPLGIDLGMV